MLHFFKYTGLVAEPWNKRLICFMLSADSIALLQEQVPVLLYLYSNCSMLMFQKMLFVFEAISFKNCL